VPESPGFYTTTIRILSTAMVGVGIALVVRAVQAGGGPFSNGVLIGVLFVAAGVGRWYLTLRRK
jgi:multisubunit Na+/H+ antiporter MnhB subunit